LSQACSTLRLSSKDGQGLAKCSGNERRRRGCKDERAGAIDEEVAENGRSSDDRTAGSQGFSARVQHEDMLASFDLGGQASSIGAEYAGCVCLIDDEEGTGPLGQALEFRGGSPVSFHRIQTFDHDPGRPGAAAPPPGSDGVVGGVNIVMCEGGGIRTPEV